MTAPTAIDEIKEEIRAKDARVMAHIHGCAHLRHGTGLGMGGGVLMFCMPEPKYLWSRVPLGTEHCCHMSDC